MMITTLLLAIVGFYLHFTAAKGNYASIASIAVSSTYIGYNFNPEYVIDGNNQTLPFTCGCCWSTKIEHAPTLSLLLDEEVLVTAIEIIGRSDHGRQVTNLLIKVNVIVDGVDMRHLLWVAENTIRVNVSTPQYLQNLTMTSPSVTSDSTWYLMICEIKVLSHGRNIFDRGISYSVVEQSSIMNDDFYTNGPRNAVDGYDGIRRSDRCSVTNNTNHSSWWQLNLGKKELVQEIYLSEQSSTMNGDQLQHAIVYAGNTSLKQGQHYGVELFTVPTTGNYTKIFDEAILSQYFLVKLDQPVLALCDFKVVRKDCEVGRFGSGCRYRCHCSDNQPCSVLSGECQTPGCHPGWRGTACNQLIECDIGKFGFLCTQNCHCHDNQTCNGVTGECQTPGCVPGWRGAACDQECLTPTFGADCGSTCHCINGTHCDHVTGHCDVEQCDPGWQGDSCSKVCDFGTFGVNCSHVCHCHDNQTCNGVTGECQTPGCVPGWRGTACDQGKITECDIGRFGVGCSEMCHCLDNKTCDFASGKCQTPECYPGWHGFACNHECEVGRFGKGCSQFCHCSDNITCNVVTGYCQTPACYPGWYGPACNQVKECDVGRYGSDCSHACHCYDNKTCNAVTGECQTPGCYPGWNGNACDVKEAKSFKTASEKTSRVWQVITGVVCVILVVVIVVVVAFYIRKTRFKNRHKKTKTSTSFSNKAANSGNSNNIFEGHMPDETSDPVYDTINSDHVETSGYSTYQPNTEITSNEYPSGVADDPYVNLQLRVL